jgi:hypothetical protein
MTISPSSAVSSSQSSGRPHSRRHLRVGVVQGPCIVEEHVFRAAEPITIGPAVSDTFILPSDVLARSWRLFEARRGRLVLRLGPSMTARLADGATVTAFAAAPDEPLRAIVLPEAARGKLTVGDTTILFQRVRPPAPRPRPQLPASVRRHVFAELDLPYLAIAALTFLLHVVVVVYLRQVDWPRKPSIDEVPDRIVQLQRRPRPPAPQVARPAPAAPAPTRPPSAPRPVAAAARPTRPVESEAERHARLADETRRKGLLAIIGSLGEGPSSTIDLLRPGKPEQEIEEALTHMDGVTEANADTLRLPRIGGDSGKVATPGTLRSTAIAAPTRTGPAIERGVKPDIHEGPPSIEDGHVDAAAIAREIRSRRKAIAACYERALKQQPTLAGKLVVRFSLTPAGTVGAVDLDDDTLGAPDVSACIRAVVLHWRFPPLTEGPAELSFPFVFQPGG